MVSKTQVFLKVYLFFLSWTIIGNVELFDSYFKMENLNSIYCTVDSNDQGMVIININCTHQRKIIVGTRERVAGEVIPIKAEHSHSDSDKAEKHGAKLAIDMNLDTFSTVKRRDTEDEIWLKVTLDQIRCVKEVLRYKKGDRSDGPYQRWTCSQNDCNSCHGKHCDYFTLTVSTEEAGAASDLPSFSDCKHGNIVKLERIGGEKMNVVEIAVIEIQGMIKFLIFVFKPGDVL